MKFKEWEKLYDKLIDDDSTQIKQFVKKYCTEFSFIEVKDDKLKQALTSIASFRKFVISFDVEFQSKIINTDMSMNIDRYVVEVNYKGDTVANFVREIGVIIFMKDRSSPNKWFYLGKIFVNFQPLPINDLTKYLFAKYATVTEDTKKKMLLNDDTFFMYDEENSKLYKMLTHKDKNKNKYLPRVNDARFQIFGKYLNSKHKTMLYNQLQLYQNDSLVKNRTVDEDLQFLNMFSNLSKYTYFVVKGRKDLEAICNSYLSVNNNKCNINFSTVFDIEMYNGLSKQLFGDAKLETTYNGVVKTEIYKQSVQPFFSQITESKSESNVAHNPVVDSLWTVVVALVIMLGLFKQFDKYYIEYQKCKAEYKQLKSI